MKLRWYLYKVEYATKKRQQQQYGPKKGEWGVQGEAYTTIRPQNVSPKPDVAPKTYVPPEALFTPKS